MLSDLFELVDGLHSEDLTSEVFAFVMREQHYASIQRLVYHYALDDDRLLSTSERDFDVNTRTAYKIGKPDIVIEGTDTAIVIENKFYAPYSQGDQLSRYFRLLNEGSEFAEIRNKVLALLTTESRMLYYSQEVVHDFQSNLDAHVTDADSLVKLLASYRITLRFLSWQEILRYFESEDIILNSISCYIRNTFIKEVKLMDNELNALESETFPSALQKLLEAVAILRERVHALGVDTKSFKFSQSIDMYGFSMTMPNVNVWFGYYRLIWTLTSPFTPLYLQFKPDWVTRGKYAEEVHMPLLLKSFQYEEDYGFLKPFRVSKLNAIDSLADELIAAAKEISTIIQKKAP